MKHGFLEVRNWGKYQHYTDRNPPWVKLHPTIIDARENPDLVSLSLPARFLAFAMICLAAKTDNLIPANPTWISVESGITRAAAKKALDELSAIEFVRPADSNGASAAASTGDSKKASPKRTETEDLGAKAPRSRQQNDEIWDTLDDLFGKTVKGTREFDKRTKAFGDLCKSEATAETIRVAHKRWHRVYEGATVTDMAIASHYARLLVGTVYAPGYKPEPEKGRVSNVIPIDVLESA